MGTCYKQRCVIHAGGEESGKKGACCRCRVSASGETDARMATAAVTVMSAASLGGGTINVCNPS